MKHSVYRVPGGCQLVEIGKKTTRCVFTGSRAKCQAEMKKLQGAPVKKRAPAGAELV